MHSFQGGSDTIFALSSGAGKAGVAVVRLSGPRSRFALETIAGSIPAARQVFVREIRAPGGDLIDKGLVVAFDGPASFTGEDCAEVHVHGGRAVVARLLDVLGGLEGLRPARAGEFVSRAFDAGKLDLTEVEGLSDLIEAETEGQRKLAVAQAGGRLRDRFTQLRRDFLSLRVKVEAAIDFSDEGDIPGDIVASFDSDRERLLGQVHALLSDARGGQALKDGVRVAVVGEPNAGKSSLVNWLAGSDVAIVSPEAGTTRDVIEVRLDLGGVPVRLFDTAGIRDAKGVEAEGVRRALEVGGSADLVVVLVDSPAFHSQAADRLVKRFGDNTEVPCWIVRSRVDLDPSFVGSGEMAISVTSGCGMDELIGNLSAFAAEKAHVVGDAVISRARQKDELLRARDCLERCGVVFRAGELELAAEELRGAGDCIGRLTGEIGAEEVLGEIFSSFCIGK